MRPWAGSKVRGILQSRLAFLIKVIHGRLASHMFLTHNNLRFDVVAKCDQAEPGCGTERGIREYHIQPQVVLA